MYVQHPHTSNGILVVQDQLNKFSHELSEEQNTTYVGEGLTLLKAMFGGDWAATTKLALYGYGQKPTPAQRAQARKEYLTYLQTHKYEVIVVLPTASKALDQSNTVQGTQVWRDLNPPDSLDDMRGAFWTYKNTYVVPVFAPLGNIGQVNLAFMTRWIQAARMVAKGKTSPLTAEVEIHPSLEMIDILASMRGKPLAIDIENIPGKDIITAVGLSDGESAASIPFESYEPACGSGWEPGLGQYGHGHAIRDLLTGLLEANTPKLLHNGVHDIPILNSRGYEFGGIIHDTLAMHAINYPEARHGLQLACASELVIPPWKSLFHPKGLKRDEPEFWYWDAESLREYNAKDAFYTWHLAKQSAWKLGADNVFT